MKYIFTLFVTFLFYGSAFPQEKVIISTGTIVDFYTHKRIKDVVLLSDYADTLAVSNKKGIFKTTSTKKFSGYFLFVHPDYYPVYEKARSHYDRHTFQVFMTPKTLKPDTVFQKAFPENKTIWGVVIDKNSEKGIEYVTIKTADSNTIAFTNDRGQFISGIPKNDKVIIVEHPKYKSRRIQLNPKKKKERLKISLLKNHYTKTDTLWKTYNNEVSLALNEFFQTAIGLRYQRFVKFRHAFGLHTSFYVHGVGITLNTSSSEYTGIKVSPYYRYYFFRSIGKNLFLEGKVTGGYFDYSKLFYAMNDDSRYGEFYKETFTTYGFGAGIGFSFIMPKTKHGIINVTVGYQYLPMNVPKSYRSDHYGPIEALPGGWYFYGPGSVVEIKFTVGGIF